MTPHTAVAHVRALMEASRHLRMVLMYALAPLACVLLVAAVAWWRVGL